MGKKYTNFKVNLDGLDKEPLWYTIVTQYNYENYVVNSINKIITEGTGNNLLLEAFSGVVELETKTYNKKGEEKIKIKNEKILPNYVFVKALMTIETWNMLTNLTGVSAILCTSGVPVSTTDEKIKETKNHLEAVKAIK